VSISELKGLKNFWLEITQFSFCAIASHARFKAAVTLTESNRMESKILRCYRGITSA
jgi:hypothetical protein